MVNLSTITNANTQDTDMEAAIPTSTNNQSVASPTLSNLSHLSQPPKKESYVRSWFNFSQNSSTPTAVNSGSISNSSLTERNPSIVAVEAAPSGGGGSYQQSDASSYNVDTLGSSPIQSTNLKQNNSKTNFGEIFLKQKLKEQPVTNPHITLTGVDDENSEQQPTLSTKEQPKSSRRTTSLLNLFMSNSQGNAFILSYCKTFLIFAFF